MRGGAESWADNDDPDRGSSAAMRGGAEPPDDPGDALSSNGLMPPDAGGLAAGPPGLPGLAGLGITRGSARE